MRVTGITTYRDAEYDIDLMRELLASSPLSPFALCTHLLCSAIKTSAIGTMVIAPTFSTYSIWLYDVNFTMKLGMWSTISVELYAAAICAEQLRLGVEHTASFQVKI